MPEFVVNDRYRMLDLLGEGGSGKTYRAFDEQNQIAVAVKVLSLLGMTDWKTLELFEREAKILAQLDHPAIPRYIDFFQTTIAGEDTFCLVQEIAPGRPLTDWIVDGYTFSEKQLRQIATQILEILIYLQAFTPPIMHRDLKPQNLLRDESENIYLVDFGAVRDTYHLTVTGGSTIVGTYGYMAPEQFRGQAVLATDLYGLGATLLYLKSGQDPADLPVQQMKIDFRHQIPTSDGFAQWLDGLLEPIPENRYRNATIALEYLHGNITPKVPRPRQPISQITQQGEMMKIVIPPIGLATRPSKKFFLKIISGSALVIIGSWLNWGVILRQWLGFLTMSIYNVVGMPIALVMLLIGAVTGIFMVGWLVRILWRYTSAVIFQHEILIDDQKTMFHTQTILYTKTIRGFLVSRQVLPVKSSKTVYHQKTKTGAIQITSSSAPISPSTFYDQIKYFSFGQYLDRSEQRWLTGEIAEHLQYLNSQVDRSS